MQKHVANSSEITTVDQLKIGQLAQIIDDDGAGFLGVIVVRTYDQLVVLVGDKYSTPFYTTWSKPEHLTRWKVRILGAGEQVILDNQ